MTKLVFNPASGELEMQDFSQTLGFDGKVSTFADLPTASANSGSIYLVEQDSGSIFLFNKREAGTYRSNGTAWVAFSDVSALSIETNNTTINAPDNNVQSALDHLSNSWEFFATNWDTAPTFNKAITGGSVYNYAHNSITRYRFVPSTYDPTQDTFYANFDSGTNTLTNPIVSRGV